MAQAPPLSRPQPPPLLEQSTPAAIVGISFSSNTSSSASSGSDGEETEEGGGGADRKRKRQGSPCGSRKMMAFFDGLMQQMMERQEAMQQRFLETIEKREQDRMIREEAWKRQEMARLNREYELMAQERTMAANRDAAVISFLQKFAGVQPNQQLTTTTTTTTTTTQEETEHPPPISPPQTQPALTLQTETNNNNNQIERHDLLLNQPTSSSEPAIGDAIMCAGGVDTISPSSSSSSRWPKPEVLALIKIRSGLDSRYLESGPKGPLWEEISLAMKRLGYVRNAKRCKEKWENINKYFKKVKESNKKRPEDAKTCPYFHELDALYRKKQIFNAQQQQTEFAVTPKSGVSVQTPAMISGIAEQESNKSQKISPVVKTSEEITRSNGTGLSALFFAGATNRVSSSSTMKKPEDFVRELMGQHGAANEYEKLGGGEAVDSDTINQEYEDEEEENEDEDDDEDDEDGKLRYEIQFQRQGVGAGGGAGGSNSTGKVPGAESAASSAGSFLAMVQ